MKIKQTRWHLHYDFFLAVEKPHPGKMQCEIYIWSVCKLKQNLYKYLDIEEAGEKNRSERDNLIASLYLSKLCRQCLNLKKINFASILKAARGWTELSNIKLCRKEMKNTFHWFANID